jgi:hypothetical protein
MTQMPLSAHNESKSARTRRPVLWTGVYTGALLTLVMLGALVAANRIPALEPHALERNGFSFSLFILFMAIPIFRFLRNPIRMFGSAIIGWILFIAAYDVAGMVFRDLFESVHHSPFLALIEGAVVYGLFAVGIWVVEMILHARRHPIGPGRKPASHIAHHRQ